ncbi:MAG: 2-dehydropantoate 2-reductase [Oscillospiraceae bacterium]|nr:2-dehydropantoate 2-reductase [Oscillospiraceae bacterium]
MRAAILGAGSLGTGMGAMIANAGGDITLIDAYREHVSALNQKGASALGTLNLHNVPVKACLLEQVEGIFDIVIYLGKGPNNDTYLPAILPHISEHSAFCVLQNGLPDDAVAKYIGWERMIGGFVLWGASLKGPGITEITAKPEKIIYEIGEYSGEITPRLLQVQQLLSQGASCVLSDSVNSVRWTKLMINAPMSGMSAVLGCTYGDLLDNRAMLECVAHLKDEVAKVAHACGVKLSVFDGLDFDDFQLRNGSDSDLNRVMDMAYSYYDKGHRKVIASMLFDLRLGRKTEINTINGAVCDRAREHGVPTPYNDLVTEIVCECEQSGATPNLENLSRFLSLR